MRYLVVAHGDCIDNLILTNDWFWGTRGHNSRNGSGTICDLKSGAVLAARHFTIQGIEEMANHLAGVHDGPGFFTGERRVCRLHAATMPDGTPFQARQWNDCVTFNSEMQAWLKKEIIDQINDIVHPTRGGCCGSIEWLAIWGAAASSRPGHGSGIRWQGRLLRMERRQSVQTNSLSFRTYLLEMRRPAQA